MYVTFPSTHGSELWVSDIDGGNKFKIATGDGLWTGTWAPDNFHVTFVDSGPAQEPKPTSLGQMAAVFVSSPEWEVFPTIRYGAQTRNPFT